MPANANVDVDVVVDAKAKQEQHKEQVRVKSQQKRQQQQPHQQQHQHQRQQKLNPNCAAFPDTQNTKYYHQKLVRMEMWMVWMVDGGWGIPSSDDRVTKQQHVVVGMNWPQQIMCNIRACATWRSCGQRKSDGFSLGKAPRLDPIDRVPVSVPLMAKDQTSPESSGLLSNLLG